MLYTFGNYDGDAVSRETGVVFTDRSLAIQSQAEEADINTIVRRFGLTGMLPQVPMPPLVDDFDAVFDFQSAMNMIVGAQRSFDALDADTRYRFRNDPALFVEFCSNPDNLDEMRKMGLAVPKVEPVASVPMEVRIVGEDKPKA